MDKDSTSIDCKELKDDGTLICAATMKNAAEITRRGIKIHHVQVNIEDEVLESPQPTKENKPIDSSKDTDADSSNKECGCSKTS